MRRHTHLFCHALFWLVALSFRPSSLRAGHTLAAGARANQFQRTGILFLLVTIAGLAASALAQVSVDGTLNGAEGYGSPLVTQTINTGFGDNTSSGGASSGGSELDAVYGVATNGYLYLFIAGNVQANGNNIDVFIADGQAGGQQVLQIGGAPGQAAMNGS